MTPPDDILAALDLLHASYPDTASHDASVATAGRARPIC
jgi:hypothetical protein